MTDACTPDNVLGAYVAGGDASGFQINELDKILEPFDSSGQGVYHKARGRARSDVYNAIPESPQQKQNDKVNSFWEKNIKAPIETVKSVIVDNQRAEGKYTPETVKPVIDFLSGHIKAYRDDIQSGRSAYFKGIKRVFEDIDTSHMTDAMKGDFETYKRFHTEGGRLYKTGKSPAIIKAIQNFGGNTIQASPTVILGNPLEMAMKLPALYPGEMFPALMKTAVKGKWFAKVPELEALGVYDTLPEEGGGLLKKTAQLLTDNPLKTAFYYAGEMKGGESGGLEAVEKGAFKYRPGNETTNEMSDVGRIATQFLNYTLNTYRMQAAWYGGLLNKETFLPSARALLTYHAVAGALGGLDAAIPEPVQFAIRTANPDLADQIDDSNTPLTNLVKLGTIDSLFVSAGMANRTFQTSRKDFGKAMQDFQNGETDKMSVHMVNATLLPFAKFTNFAGLGDAQIQKLIKIAEDIFITHELDTSPESLNPRLQKDYASFLGK